MAVDFPNSPKTGDIWQNPVTQTYYQWNGDDWRVMCFTGQLDCDPTGTWTQYVETVGNSGPPDGANGFFWKVYTEDNAGIYDQVGTTALFLSPDARLPGDTWGSYGNEPPVIVLNGTPFVVRKWTHGSNVYNSLVLVGDQREWLEANGENNPVEYKFCDDNAYVTLDYFKADQERQDDKIVELEEEFENLLPSLDRGSWKYNEDFTKPPGKFGLRTGGGGLPTAFDQVEKIIFNKVDDAGEPHGFGDVHVDSYIQLFQDGENDTAIYHVDVAPVANGDEFEIEVSFVRAEGDYPSLDELFRFKFYEIAAGNPGEFVLRAGDTMTGDLEITVDPNKTGEFAAALILEGRRTTGTESCGTVAFKNENVTDVTKTGYLTYRNYNNTQTFVLNKNVKGEGNITAVGELRGTVLNSAKDANLLIQRNNDTKILVGSDAINMQKPVKLVSAAYATADDHVVHKKYVDDKFDFRTYSELS